MVFAGKINDGPSFLIRYKWNRFGRYVYLIMLLLYVLFLLALTIYTVAAPAPYSPSQIIELAQQLVLSESIIKNLEVLLIFTNS